MTSTDTGRTAILRAARRAFARHSYDAVTLRHIATEAGVSAPLIVKHFGGKESLFAAVADFSEAADLLLAAPNAELGRHAVLTLVRYRRANQSDLLLRVVFAAGGNDERILLRDRFRDQVVNRLAERLTGPGAAVRAELVVAQLLGLAAANAVNHDGPIASSTPEELADRYGPCLQSLIDE